MKLIHKSTGKEVKLGDKVVNFRGEKGFVMDMPRPRSPASTGHLYTSRKKGNTDSHSWEMSYCGVWDTEWVEREDRT